MLSSPPQQPAVGQAADMEEKFDIVAVGGDTGEGIQESRVPIDPSICTFWCAVAIGALVKGRPIDSVRDMRVCAQQNDANRADRRQYASSPVI